MANRSERETKEFCDQHQISTQGKNIPKAVLTFEEASFPEYVLQELSNAGFSAPTPIQSVSWPIALSGRDMVYLNLMG